MTRPVSEPQRVKNHTRRSKYQAKAPVTSHETRSQWTLNQVPLPCVFYHKPAGVVHKPFKRDRIATMYARGIRSPSEGETVRASLGSGASSRYSPCGGVDRGLQPSQGALGLLAPV